MKCKNTLLTNTQFKGVLSLFLMDCEHNNSIELFAESKMLLIDAYVSHLVQNKLMGNKEAICKHHETAADR